MRILFILDEFLPENNGGAANIAFSLAKGLIQRGNEVLVLTATYDLGKVGELEVEGIKVRIVFTSPFGRLRNWKNLKNYRILRETRNILMEYKPDIVHIHALHHRFSYGVIKLAKKYSRAVFFTLHDAQTIFNGKLYPKRKIYNVNPSYNYKITWFGRLKKDGFAYNPLQRLFIKRALKKIDKIFAVSDALKKALEVNGVNGIGTIHNGIDAQEWVLNDTQENNVLFIGRVDEAKGAEVVLRVFQTANHQIPNATLTMVGDDNFSPFGRSPEGGKAGDNKNIRILPWQYKKSAVKKLFAESKIVIVPSCYLDPFPTVNLEAMASGKPVIGTCFGGTLEAVVDNETGYIVNPYDEKELADKIIDLLKNPEKAKRFGVNGRERIEKYFSLDRQVQKTLDWYRKFL